GLRPVSPDTGQRRPFPTRVSRAWKWAPFCFGGSDVAMPASQESTIMPSHTVSRRRLIQQAGVFGSAALAGSLLSTRVQASTALETRAAKLGFIALTDAAPLFVADEKGFFKKHGM